MRICIYLIGVVLLLAGYSLFAIEPQDASPSEDTTATTVSRNQERHSPHEAIAIHVYVTPDGEQALRDGTADYPVGTILLKEKLIGERERRTELFTGMLKRESGYNSDCGDWEFFTIDGSASRVTARGRIDSCMECHSEYKDSAYVARDYLFDGRNGPARLRIGTQPRPDAGNTATAHWQWRDSDLVAAVRSRSLVMVRTTDDPYTDLDPSVFYDCAAPDASLRVDTYSRSPSRGGSIAADSIRDRDYVHSGDDRTPFFGTFGEAPEFSDRFADRKWIPRILLGPNENRW